MIAQLQEFLITHQAAVTLAAAWLTREAHVWWPRLVSIYPYCRDNGGIIGIAKNFLSGKPTNPEAKP